MRLDDWLVTSQQQLGDVGIATARLDALVLLEDALRIDRAQILAEPDRDLSSAQQKLLNGQLQRRIEHIPLSYIRGKSEFYGREFMVNEHTLEPRPETETMVELLKTLVPSPTRHSELVSGPRANQQVLGSTPLQTSDEVPKHAPRIRWVVRHDEKEEEVIRVLDVGTGSGCIAITAKLECSSLSVDACDIDDNCLAVAQRNAKNLRADVKFFKSNLLENTQEDYDILLMNLPYVPDNFQINRAATHEPKHAIFGGSDGLDLYRELFEQLKSIDWKPKYILTESLPPQHELLAKIAASHGYQLERTNDFIQVFELQ